MKTGPGRVSVEVKRESKKTIKKKLIHIGDSRSHKKRKKCDGGNEGKRNRKEKSNGIKIKTVCYIPWAR